MRGLELHARSLADGGPLRLAALGQRLLDGGLAGLALRGAQLNRRPCGGSSQQQAQRFELQFLQAGHRNTQLMLLPVLNRPFKRVLESIREQIIQLD